MDNNYIAFRRNAVRYLSAAPRVMWKNRSGKTTLSTDPKSPKKGMETSGTTSDPYAELKVRRFPDDRHTPTPVWCGRVTAGAAVNATRRVPRPMCVSSNRHRPVTQRQSRRQREGGPTSTTPDPTRHNTDRPACEESLLPRTDDG